MGCQHLPTRLDAVSSVHLQPPSLAPSRGGHPQELWHRPGVHRDGQCIQQKTWPGDGGRQAGNPKDGELLLQSLIPDPEITWCTENNSKSQTPQQGRKKREMEPWEFSSERCRGQRGQTSCACGSPEEIQGRFPRVV